MLLCEYLSSGDNTLLSVNNYSAHIEYANVLGVYISEW